MAVETKRLGDPAGDRRSPRDQRAMGAMGAHGGDQLRAPGVKVISARAIQQAGRLAGQAGDRYEGAVEIASPIARAVMAAISSPMPTIAAKSSRLSPVMTVESISAISTALRRPSPAPG